MRFIILYFCSGIFGAGSLQDQEPTEIYYPLNIRVHLFFRCFFLKFVLTACFLVSGSLSAQEEIKIDSVFPVQNELHVSRDVTVTATFTMPLDIASITSETFIVRGEDSGPAAGMVSYDSSTNIASFKPAKSFFAGEIVTVNLTNAIRTPQQEPFAGFTWQFTVEAFQATPPFFVEGKNLRIPQAQETLYTVDVDKDSDLDIIIGQRFTNEPVSVTKNDGKGNFSQFETYLLSVDARSIYGNDFDNDGDIDLVVTTASIQDRIAVLVNDGFGFFSVVKRFSQAFHEITEVSATIGGDFDNDGNVDLVYISAFIDSAKGLVGFLKNDGTGNFTEMNQIKLRNRPTQISLADFNNDGWLDVVAGMRVTTGQIELWSGMGVLLNNANGAFSEPVYYRFLLLTDSFYCNDFDDDGDIDIAVAMNPEGLLIYLNDGHGGFPDSVDLRDRDSIFSVWGADFDGDTDIDVVEIEAPRLPDFVLPVVRLYNNPGDGQFSRFEVNILKMSGINRGYGRRPDGGDLDGDGDIDLVVPFDSSGSWLSFFFNQEDPVGVEDNDLKLPDDFSLEQNYPNPFNQETTIAFTLPSKSYVKLTVYNVQGQEFITLLDALMPPGRHKTYWSGINRHSRNVGSGIYYYKLEVWSEGTDTQFSESRKMLLLK